MKLRNIFARVFLIANRLGSNSNCPAGPLRNTMGEPPCKKQCNIATFFRPCLNQKISADTSNSSNEARGTSDVSDEIDRVLDGNTLSDDIPVPKESHTSTSSNTGTSLSNDKHLQDTFSTTSYLVPVQPNQPTTIKFPKLQFGKFNRAFQGTWFNDFPWLHYDETNDKVLCHTCMMRAEFEGKLRTARNKDPVFVIDGYCNWKKVLERFREHQTSACHLLAIDSIVTLPKTCADIAWVIFI